MHAILDETWSELPRLVKDGGFVAVLAEGAPRSMNKQFELHPNAARITMTLRKHGFTALPSIIWRRPAHNHNTFMGSGTLPAGAYVTLDSSHILLFRKGGLRRFPAEEDKMRRRESAFFYEERNTWFSGVWNLADETPRGPSPREVSHLPAEVVKRLVRMTTIKDDTVLAPFWEGGNTALISALERRNSHAFMHAHTSLKPIDRAFFNLPFESLLHVNDRLNAHRRYIEALNRSVPHYNANIRMPVVSEQETDIVFDTVTRVEKEDAFYTVYYE